LSYLGDWRVGRSSVWSSLMKRRTGTGQEHRNGRVRVGKTRGSGKWRERRGFDKATFVFRHNERATLQHHHAVNSITHRRRNETKIAFIFSGTNLYVSKNGVAGECGARNGAFLDHSEQRASGHWFLTEGCGWRWQLLWVADDDEGKKTVSCWGGRVERWWLW